MYPAPSSFNLARYVLAAGAATPDKTALALVGEEAPIPYSYGALIDAVERTAAGLCASGLAKGDIIILRLGNTPDFPITYLGAIYAGIIPAPISQQLTTSEVAKICANLRPAAIITDDHTIYTDVRVIQLANLPDAARVPCDLGDADRPAYIIHTSGTSGTPRAVVHAHRAILARRMMWDGWYGLHPTDRMLHAGAFNWTFTLGTGLLDPWTIGATALIPAPHTDAATLPHIVQAHDATRFAAAPGEFRRMLRGQMPQFTQLRHALCAGEKLPSSLQDNWRKQTGTPIHEAYGMSECSTFISGSPARPAPAGTLGYVQDGRQVKIMADGQIAIHRDDAGLMLGYYNAPDATQARYDGDWFLTGDMGHMDDSGAVIYAGRVDDMMNAGGYRVSPVEVEEAVLSHPHVQDAAACAVNIRADTSLIALFYTAENLIDEAELRRHMAERVAAYKCPRIFVQMPALPRGANNKLLRRELRKNWEAAHGQA